MGGGTILGIYGGHSCYDGGHKAHEGPPSPPPPLGKTLGSTVKAAYISHFVLLDNEESFPEVMVNSAPSLAPLLCQGHVTVM